MRIWDISVRKLCRDHLLGEHRELHAIWSVIINKKKGYSYHPEILRWVGKLKALYLRHDKLVEEMLKRGYLHKSPLLLKFAKGASRQDTFLVSIREQSQILKNKKCRCRVE